MNTDKANPLFVHLSRLFPIEREIFVLFVVFVVPCLLIGT